MTGVEGRARIEGVAASIHESYMDGHGNKVAEDAVFTTPCLHNSLRGDHLQRGPPIPEGPVEIREQAAENDGTPRQGGKPSSDAGGDTSTNNIRRGDTPTNKICRGAPRATHEQDRITNEMV